MEDHKLKSVHQFLVCVAMQKMSTTNLQKIQEDAHAGRFQVTTGAFTSFNPATQTIAFLQWNATEKEYDVISMDGTRRRLEDRRMTQYGAFHYGAPLENGYEPILAKTDVLERALTPVPVSQQIMEKQRELEGAQRLAARLERQQHEDGSVEREYANGVQDDLDNLYVQAGTTAEIESVKVQLEQCRNRQKVNDALSRNKDLSHARRKEIAMERQADFKLEGVLVVKLQSLQDALEFSKPLVQPKPTGMKGYDHHALQRYIRHAVTQKNLYEALWGAMKWKAPEASLSNGNGYTIQGWTNAAMMSLATEVRGIVHRFSDSGWVVERKQDKNRMTLWVHH